MNTHTHFVERSAFLCRLIWRAIVVLGVVVSALSSVGCDDVCGTYELVLPETREVDDRFAKNPVEMCDDGSQGNWVPGDVSYIAFQPDEKGLSTNFVYTNMLITVEFRTDDAVEGAVLTGNDLGGLAFYGLAMEHRDSSPLLKDKSTIIIHSIGEESGDGLYRRRYVDVEWDLQWSNGRGAHWKASGRKDMLMLRSTR